MSGNDRAAINSSLFKQDYEFELEPGQRFSPPLQTRDSRCSITVGTVYAYRKTAPLTRNSPPPDRAAA